ncbi:hypothetical protein RHSIM_Rhsim10G0047800 [Rhododendron simsii]|uniref:Uncharacterized protein n=1 Tax=Rhododendron simsii TaxID=118357 RepID=A0A834G959_RHOSS|nr:hypothetical protein RHSIM_Rhsim10G0047800 [Rhododendron simsii]
MASAAKSIIQTLRRYIKKPWEITGPCVDLENKPALPKAIEYRVFCPATAPAKALIPNSDPDTVYHIEYYSCDRRRSRPPVRCTMLRKADVEGMMRGKSFDADDFPRPYLPAKVEEDDDVVGGGYQK